MTKNNKKCVYKVNENCKPKRKGRLPMFENFIEHRYSVDFTLIDNKKYKLTQDIVAEDGTVLAKAGDTVIYRDGMGTFGNKVQQFVSDCGSFETSDGQNLQPEILLSNGVVTDPANELKADPTAPVVMAVAECRKAMRPMSRKVYEELSDEDKKKYQEKQSKLTDEQKEKLTAKIDGFEQDAMEAGEKQDWKKLRSLYKQALEAYRTVTGGEEPGWYEGEDPYAEMVGESLTDEQKAKYKEKQAKLSDADKERMTKELDEMEEKAFQLQEEGKIAEIDKLTKKSLEMYRVLTGGEDPAWYEDFMDDPKFGVNENEDIDLGGEGLEDISEDEAKEAITDEIIEKDELKEILTDDAELAEDVADKVIDALPADKEDYSMVDVVKAVVSEEVPTEDANKVIDALVDGALKEGEEEIVNESAKTKIKGKIMESLKKSYRRSVFESRYVKKRKGQK